MPEDLSFLPIAEAARLILRREISPVDLVQACLDRIAAVDGAIHSYLLVLADEALAQARVAEAEIAAGRWRGPLHGIPFGVKDNYDTAGVRTCAASRLMLDNVPTRTATAILKLQAAGAILLGKLNTWEYGTGNGSVNFDLPFEPAHNPWDAARFTGGSSSGAGAAVGGGTAMFALGSDTGGSVRLPAAGCGVVGLKPTFGLVSRAGMLPNCWSLDVAGPLTRTAEDAAIVLRALEGHDPADMATVDRAPVDYLRGIGDGIAGLTIGVLRSFDDSAAPLQPAVAAAMEAMVSELEFQGAVIVELRLPAPFSAFKTVNSVINWSESFSIHEQDFLQRGELMGQALREKMMSGFSVRAADYLAAQRQRRVLSAAMDAMLATVDAVVLPITNRVAPKLEDGEAVIGFTRDSYASLFNASGHPAMAVPTGFDEDGMPTSAQIVGRFFDDAMVLRVGHAYGRATAWHTKIPAIPQESLA